MDTPLLSKMVKELILTNDAVTLPGIGTFVAELTGATFSDKGYTINPPYRRLSFTQREGSDTLLAEIYAGSNNISYEDSLRILTEFLATLKAELTARKSVPFPGLGRLRATRENNFFFIADEDLDIYPDGFGLEPISLKTHEETEEEVTAAVAGLASLLGEEQETAPAPAAPEAESEPVPVTKEDLQVLVAEQVKAALAEHRAAVQDAPAVQRVAGAKKQRSRGTRIALRILLALLIAAALFFGAFFLAAHFAPDWLDTLLYNAEELAILRA